MGANGAFSTLLGRDRLAAVTLAVAFVALFGTASMLAQCHHEREQHFAREWYATGESLLAQGRPGEAVEAFENALVYGHEEPTQLRLAQALVAAGRDEKARTYLSSLWQRQPGEGVVNLELARLAAREGRLQDSARHYQQAVNGSWAVGDPVAARRRVRFELAELLVQQGATAAAEAELIRLLAEPPRDVDMIARLGHLFLGVDNPRRALEAFRRALARQPRHPGALGGAGQASLALGDAARAVRYLEAAVRERPGGPDAARLEVARHARDLDPFRPRLSSRERGRRAVAAWKATLERVSSCPAAPGAPPEVEGAGPGLAVRSSLEALAPRMKASQVGRDPDLLEEAMQRVFAAQAWARGRCGEPRPVDAALGIIAGARSTEGA